MHFDAEAPRLAHGDIAGHCPSRGCFSLLHTVASHTGVAYHTVSFTAETLSTPFQRTTVPASLPGVTLEARPENLQQT